MRGDINSHPSIFSYVDLESRIPKQHPIRKIRRVVDETLAEIEPWFDEMCASQGRPSIPPEILIRASLLQIFFTIRSERQLVERIDYDLLFRWFVGLGLDDDEWNHSTFAKNRDRLMAHRVDEKLFEAIKKQAYAKKLMSRDHFTVDGTLLDTCAGMKAFKLKADSSSDNESGSGENFHGEKRSSKTYESTTAPDSRLFRKGKEKDAKLCFMEHLLTENRNGLIVDAEASLAGTSSEWGSNINLLVNQSSRPGQTVGADKGYDTSEFVEGCRELKITPHVAAKAAGSQVDGRTTSSEDY